MEYKEYKLCEGTKDIISNIIKYSVERWWWCRKKKAIINPNPEAELYSSWLDDEWSLKIIPLDFGRKKYILLSDSVIENCDSFYLNKSSIIKGLVLMVRDYPKDMDNLIKLCNYKFFQKKFSSYDQQKFCEDHGDNILNVFFQIVIFGYIKYANSRFLITENNYNA